MSTRSALVFGVVYLGFAAGQSSRCQPSAAREAKASTTDQPARADRYGDPLPSGAIARLGTTRLRHLDRAFDVAFSPDGKILASAGADNRIRLWEIPTWRQLRVLAGHTDWITAIAFSPTGKVLASAGNDGTLQLWDPTTGRVIGEPIRASTSSSFLAFAADGKTLAFSNSDGGIRLWDIAAGKEIRRLTAKPYTNTAAFAPDGRILATASNEGAGVPVIRMWDTATGKELWRSAGHKQAAWSVAFSPDGKTLASGGQDFFDEQGRPHGSIKLWDPATGKQLREVSGLRQIVDAVRFSPDSKFLVSTGRLGPTILWDWKAVNGPRRVWEDHDRASGIAFAPDSRRLAWCTRHAIRVIDLPPRKDRNQLGGHAGPIPFVAFAPDGKTVVSAGETVRVWDAATGEELRSSPEPFKEFCAAALSPDGKILATGSREGTRLWDLATMKVLRSFSVPGGYAVVLALSPDGKTLVTAIEAPIYFIRQGQPYVRKIREDVLRLWDVGTGKEQRQLGKGIYPEFLAYSPDGTRLATVVINAESIRIWDVKKGVVSVELKRETGTSWSGQSVVRFSPDGQLLASGHSDGMVWLWGAHSGKPVHPLRGHQRSVRAVAFSPDGKTLSTASDDEKLRLWDVATGKLLHELIGHQAAVLTAAFSPDGKRIASASADATILIWDVPGLSTRVLPPPTLPTAEELYGLWIDLGGDGPSERAIRRLVAAPKSAVPFLRQRLKPDLPRDDRAARLLADLDSDEFAVREKASRELARMGKRVEPTLRCALGEKPSPEKRRRVQALLEALPRPQRPRRGLAPEEQRLVRAAVVLDRIGTPEALDLLHHLACATDLPAIVADRSVISGEILEAKAALARLANRRAKP